MTCTEEKMCKGAQKVKEKRNPEKLLSYTLRRAMPKYENCVFIKDISKCKKHFYASKKNNMLARQKKAQIKCALDAENCCALKKKKKLYKMCKKNILILYLSTLLSLYLQFKKKN